MIYFWISLILILTFFLNIFKTCFPEEKFNVGRVFEMSLEIKPRVQNGVIMSVHGRRDFVMLQLKDGNVEFSVDNGKGIISSTYIPSNPFGMCDGNWHSISGNFVLD